MKIKIKSSSLVEALKRAKLVASRGSLPALGCALIEADNGKLHVTGTNIEQRISSSVDAEVDTSGACLVSCERLLAIAAQVNGEVSLSVKSDQVSVSGGGIKANLHGLPINDFPDESDVNPFTASFNGGDFADALSRVASAMSVDKARYILNGVGLMSRDGDAVIAASNGNTLHLLRIPEIGDAKFETVIPAAAVSQIISLFSGQTVMVHVSEKRIQVNSPDITLSSKIVEGTFPNVFAVIPAEKKPDLIAKSESLVSAIEVVASGRDNLNRCRVASTKAGIEFSADIEGGGTIRKMVDEPQKSESEMVFNWNYLRDAIKAARSEVVEIATDAKGPNVIRNGHFTAVVMPMASNAAK